MFFQRQLKLGPELLDESGEAWLGYYLFAFITLGVLGGVGWWVRDAELSAATRILAGLMVGLGFLVSLSTCMICHFFGHLFDTLTELREAGLLDPAGSAETKAAFIPPKAG